MTLAKFSTWTTRCLGGRSGTRLRCHAVSGQVTGITNGRLNIGPEFSLANHVVSIRLRSVGGAGGGQVGKSATMIWPSADWPWEFDLAETIPGTPGVTSYHHIESQPGNTVSNFLTGAPAVNPFAWHTYTIEFLGGATVTGINYLVDGQLLTFKKDVTDKPVTTITGAWVPPSGVGHIAIGKALPAGNKRPSQTEAPCHSPISMQCRSTG